MQKNHGKTTETMYICQRENIEGQVPQQRQLEFWQDVVKRAKIKNNNVTMTEEK